MIAEESAGSHPEVSSSPAPLRRETPVAPTSVVRPEVIGETIIIKPDGAMFPQILLNIGFFVALLLAGACFVAAALYLNTFLKGTNQAIQELILQASSAGSTLSHATLEIAINARLVMGRIALLSCGVFTGMSFGFLGFALFLIGIKDQMNVSGSSETHYIKLARLSPGVFVILCATLLVGICVTRSTPFTYDNKTSAAPLKKSSSQDDVPEYPKGMNPVP